MFSAVSSLLYLLFASVHYKWKWPPTFYLGKKTVTFDSISLFYYYICRSAVKVLFNYIIKYYLT